MRKPYTGMEVRDLGSLSYMTQNSPSDGTCGGGSGCGPYDNDGGGNGGGNSGNPNNPDRDQ